jgi:phage gpG-like protein
MLQVSLAGNASAALAALPERLRARLFAKADALAAELEAKIRQKLAGGVLQQRSGALSRSIAASVQQAEAGVTATIASGGIKYAAVQEFGGTIPPHEIVPDKAKALAFVIGGKQQFARRAHIQELKMPERSYMRSSLSEMAQEITAELTEAVGRGAR